MLDKGPTAAPEPPLEHFSSSLLALQRGSGNLAVEEHSGGEDQPQCGPMRSFPYDPMTLRQVLFPSLPRVTLPLLGHFPACPAILQISKYLETELTESFRGNSPSSLSPFFSCH